MPIRSIMVIAGEASGDTLGAELVTAIKGRAADKIEFIGAGGPKSANAGVELAFDLTEHAVVGIWEVVKNYGKFRGFFNQLLDLAKTRRPDVVILIDYPGFNLRFAKAIKEFSSKTSGWKPQVVFYVSPQIWAWHESRVYEIARNIDLMLTIFPFEKAWYAERVPEFRVEYVGHPLVDRFQLPQRQQETGKQEVLLLPGSRVRELRKHLPPMIQAVEKLKNVRCTMVVPNESLGQLAETFLAGRNVHVQIGKLDEALKRATIAIASSGTVTMECAFFRVPTIVIYKTSWSTYQLGRRFIRVKYLAMPNLLGEEEIYPELIQDDASGEKIADEAIRLLNNPDRRSVIQRRLDDVIASLGSNGASQRAAGLVLALKP
ncbi:MAG: lipid-A-disaccharide synthase [Verrucomicrobiota bacterium]|nr:lipid-A-disaccharide synthase [Verrucomicrobiota bacterium]